ncbi:porin [Cupriavidus sp. PET2-C1]
MKAQTKITALALAIGAAFAGHANAQSNVTLYGLIDTTISTISNADAKGDRLTGYHQPAWFSGNRWGLTGAEDIGFGTKVIFKLESEFQSYNGAMDTPGVLFNRDAWVGINSDVFGKLTFGRQNALGRDPMASGLYGDPYGPAAITTEEGGYTNNNNFKQLVFYAGSATGTRMDNGVVWKKLFDNGLTAGAGYQFGEVPGAPSRNTTETVTLGYNGGNFHVSSFFTQANVNGQRNRTYSAGGNYVWGIVRASAGYFHYTAEQGALGQRKDDAYTVSLKIDPAGAFDYEIGYQMMKAGHAALNADGFTINAYGNTANSTATDSGRKNTVYGSIFYHFSKRTEVYLAADYMFLQHGYHAAQSNGFAHQSEFAVGMRTRF